MIKTKCYVSTTYDPFLNIATEEWLFNNALEHDQILYLWRNKDTVIIGRNQNPWAECNLQKMESEGVSLVRRHSGGGAVFQDLGNSIFTFISHKQNYDKDKNYQIILNTLRKFNIQAARSGRNDIVVNGKKISGNAYKESNNRALHHGTLLVNVDLSRLANYLTPSQKKLISKGTTSVKARVANLVEYNHQITHNALMDAIIKEFFSTYKSEILIEHLDQHQLFSIPEIKKHYEFLKSDAWRFGEIPEFDHHMEERFDWGSVSIHLNAKKGKIEDLKIFSDAIDTELIDILQNALKDSPYHPEAVQEQMSLLQKRTPKLHVNINEFANWLIKEMT